MFRPPPKLTRTDTLLPDTPVFLSVTGGEVTFDVYHCPGHTPGHVVFHHAPSKLAIVGDVLFQGSIGRTDFPMGNHADLIEAITTKLWPLGDDTAFVPGHGQMSSFAHARQTNPFRPEERRDGKGCVSRGRFRWRPDH